MNKKNVFLLHGPDQFLIELERNKLVYKLKKDGYFERKIFLSNTPFFSYEELMKEQYIDMFSSKKIIDLRLEKAPSKGEAELLEEFLKNLPEEISIVLSLLGLENVKSRAWFKKLLNYSKDYEVKKIWPNQKKQWLKGLSKSFNIDISEEEIDLIIEKTQGNLLSSYQELKMVKVLNGSTENNFISESSNFDIFNLSNSILKEDIEKSLQILDYLKLQKGSEALVVWGLFREIERISFLKEDPNTKLNGPFDYLDNIKAKSKKLDGKQIIYFKKKIALLDIGFKNGKDNFWMNAERLIIEFIRPEFLQ
jgi:DNA polymerase-3 subunit delta